MNNFLNLKSFLKFLGRNQLYTIIEILGLSVSLMFVIVIAIYTKQELSTDNFQKNADRTYVLGNEQFLLSAYGIGERLMDRFPEIEKVMTITSNFSWGGSVKIPVSFEDKKAKAAVLYSYEDFFDFFSFELIDGTEKQVLADKNSVVISQTFANSFFGNENPIGKTIEIAPSVFVSVSGIMKDFRNSVLPECDLLMRIEKLTEIYPRMNKSDYSNGLNSVVFLLAKEGANIQSKTGDMEVYLKDFYWMYRNGQFKQVVLTPLKEAYFSNTGEFSILVKGNWSFVMILMSVGILILLFAIINYINLTMAQTGFRAKEAAIRNLLGSSQKELFIRLMLESTLLCICSFLIGLCLAWLVIPYADQLLETKIDLRQTVSITDISLAVLFIVLLGCISGFLLAIHISRAKAIQVVKGSFRLQTKMWFSKIFITFQSAITIALVVASLVMILQIDHLIKAPLGYNVKNIMNIEVADLNDNEMIRTLANEIEQLARVNRIGFTRSTPFQRGNNYTMEINGKVIRLQGFVMDSTAFDMLGLQIIMDNHLGSGEGYFLNEYAFDLMEIGKDAESFPFFDVPKPIAGGIKDFRLNNIMVEKSPVFVRLEKRDKVPTENLLVETQGDLFQVTKEIKEIYEKLTHLEFTGRYIEQEIEDSFAIQKRTSKIVFLFSVIALIISLLGLLAMSTYFIQQRSREIAVRRVFGSARKQILVSLVKTFLSYVGIAFIIVTPVIGYIMNQWLTDYSYRIALHPLIFIIAGLFCFCVSFLTVFWQSYKAANKNPVDNIKVE